MIDAVGAAHAGDYDVSTERIWGLECSEGRGWLLHLQVGFLTMEGEGGDEHTKRSILGSIPARSQVRLAWRMASTKAVQQLDPWLLGLSE